MPFKVAICLWTPRLLTGNSSAPNPRLTQFGPSSALIHVGKGQTALGLFYSEHLSLSPPQKDGCWSSIALRAQDTNALLPDWWLPAWRRSLADELQNKDIPLAPTCLAMPLPPSHTSHKCGTSTLPVFWAHLRRYSSAASVAGKIFGSLPSPICAALLIPAHFCCPRWRSLTAMALSTSCCDEISRSGSQRGHAGRRWVGPWPLTMGGHYADLVVTLPCALRAAALGCRRPDTSSLLRRAALSC